MGTGLAICTARTNALTVKEGVAHQRLLEAATADNTRRTYRNAVKHFQGWGGLLPCEETDIVRYLLAHAETHNPRTLTLYLTALAQWHRTQGFADPTVSPTVRKTLTGMAREFGRPRQRARALPVEDLERIIRYLSHQGELAAVRDSALLQLGYFGAFRRSELVALQCQDLVWETRGLRILLPRSKTDQEGEGIERVIPLGDTLCPTRALRTWLDAASISEGPLFRRITRWGKIGAESLNPASVNAILSARAQQTGLDYEPELSSHSLRRGLATSAYLAGAGFKEIKKQGGWRHDGTVHGYIEDADAFVSNAAGALLQYSTKHGD